MNLEEWLHERGFHIEDPPSPPNEFPRSRRSCSKGVHITELDEYVDEDWPWCDRRRDVSVETLYAKVPRDTPITCAICRSEVLFWSSLDEDEPEEDDEDF